jgi:hypothetical protein
MRRAQLSRIGFALLLTGLGVSLSAHAELPCCASGDNGKPHAMAVPTQTDLGKAAPEAQNLSAAPDWRVYVFTRDTVRYVELTDATGVPRAAYTVVGDRVLALPIGSDVVQQVAVAPPVAVVVYQDDYSVVGVVTNADGTVTWQVFVK